MLALLVFVLGLEGVDRALLERTMGSMKPPPRPDALQLLLNPPPLQPPPPPAPKIVDPAWVDN